MKLRKIGNRNKKGITPIIAVILLMMMTVAAAGAAFFWFVRMQSELQGGSESHSSNLAKTISTRAGVIVVDLDGSTLNLYIKNQGGTEIPVETGSSHPTTTFTLQEAGGKVICSTYLDSSHASCSAGCGDSIEIGETQKIAMSLSGDCSLSSYINNTDFIFELDFSGHATTGGVFGK
jgi:flagellin-like protein